MISIICCSIDSSRAEAIKKHYQALLGQYPHEIIAIRDARSLAEAYNRGIKQAQGDIVIFSHDDIEFLDPETWLVRLRSHLAKFDLIGVAGTTKLITAAWAAAGPPYTFGQVGELDGGVSPFRVLICGVPSPTVPNIQALDGVFLAATRDVVQKLLFDEQAFDGFHCYDIDFSYSAFRAGFRLAVANDLPILHASMGIFDKKWELYGKRFLEKHHHHLPPSAGRPFQHSIVGAQTKQEVLEILNAPQTHWRRVVSEEEMRVSYYRGRVQ
ncbi:MAG: glycosyltransferase [Sulfuricellaceae bacterium]